MKKLITWVEIPSIDFERAVNFYAEILKTEFQKQDFGTEKMACLPGGEGAIIQHPNYQPSNQGVLVSFAVADSIEDTIERVLANGGKIIQPKTKIDVEGGGYFAVFLDSEGNKLGLYQD